MDSVLPSGVIGGKKAALTLVGGSAVGFWVMGEEDGLARDGLSVLVVGVDRAVVGCPVGGGAGRGDAWVKKSS